MDTTHFTQALLDLEDKGLRRSLRTVKSTQAARIVLDGAEVLNFCSNNYLGLADDIRIKEAMIRSVQEYGAGSGASRLVSGNTTAHEDLERKLADFKGAEACVVFSTGYMANVGIISSICDRHDVILSDKLNHASIIDGSGLSGAQAYRYKHNDIAHLAELLEKAADAKKRLIVTDSVFSMDGDTAPIDKLVACAKKYNAYLMIDEAHALGVFGANGCGLVEQYGLEKEVDIQMGTLSKAAGVFGAYCCGSQALISFLISKARSFIYTTGMPPAVAAAASAAIDIIQNEPARRESLWNNVRAMSEGLRAAGFNTGASVSPIIPIIVGDERTALDFSSRLLHEGVFVQAIRPPTVPVKTTRLRLTVMATHTNEDIAYVLEKITMIGKELCVI